MLKALSDLDLPPRTALLLAVVLMVMVVGIAAWAGRRFGSDRPRTGKQAERAQETAEPAETALAITEHDEEPKKILSIDYFLSLVGGSSIIVGLIIIAKTGSAFLLSSAVPLILNGLALVALGYATALLKRILNHSRQFQSGAPRTGSGSAARSDWQASWEARVPKAPSAPKPPSRQTGVYKDHEVIVHASGEVDAKVRSGWKRFASLDELDKYVSSARYKHNL